jgi:hypothetical protein
MPSPLRVIRGLPVPKSRVTDISKHKPSHRWRGVFELSPPSSGSRPIFPHLSSLREDVESSDEILMYVRWYTTIKTLPELPCRSSRSLPENLIPVAPTPGGIKRVLREGDQGDKVEQRELAAPQSIPQVLCPRIGCRLLNPLAAAWSKRGLWPAVTGGERPHVALSSEWLALSNSCFGQQGTGWIAKHGPRTTA